MKRGQVVIVDWPLFRATAAAHSKSRPALVVQNDKANSRLTNTILAMLIVGRLINRVDLTHGGWRDNDIPSPDPNGSITLANGSDGLALAIQQKDAGMSGEFDGPALKNYVAHIVLFADKGSDMEFDWAVRSRSSSETADVFLNVAISQESMTLYLSPDGGSNQALTAAVPVPGLQAAKTMDLWILVNGTDIQLWLGSKKVADVTETTVSGPTTPNFYIQGQPKSVVHLTTVVYYAVS